MQLALGEECLSFHLESCHSYPCRMSSPLPSLTPAAATHIALTCVGPVGPADYSCFKPQEGIVSYLPTPSLCNSQPSVYGESPHLHQTFQVSPAIGVFLDTQFPPSQHVPAFSCLQLQGLHFCGGWGTRWFFLHFRGAHSHPGKA